MSDLSHSTYDAELVGLLREGAGLDASDLHLVAGNPATFRVHGRLHPSGSELPGEAIDRMVGSILPEPMRGRVGQWTDFDFSITLPGDQAARLRVNVFYAQGRLGSAFRFIPRSIPTFEWMGFPESWAEHIASLASGLVLITGVTGSGKSTTLAGIVNRINAKGNHRILTIEQPVEYVFAAAGNSVITQREVGVDVGSFADGLKFGLRQDPDVILVGEIRDSDTAQMALSAAETGHLVLSTVHTQDAKGAVTRLMDLFPNDRQSDARSQLSFSLKCVISQHLLPHVDPKRKRVLAMEVLVGSDAVRAGIRQNKIESLDSLIQTGRKFGMQTLDEHLARLVTARRVPAEAARRIAKDPAAIPVVRG
jgi:twitching motility protein PilT